jgi:phosphatidylserine/phosphatidylglycerophosphate/cardiolipin synthase-like enzyme
VPSKLRVLIRRALLGCLLAAWAVTAWHHSHKSLPPGAHLASPSCPVSRADVGFIADITASDAFGQPVVSQGIFDAVLAVAHGASRFILIDYRTFADEPQATAAAVAPRRALAEELTRELLARHAALPQLQILVLTDPASERYGAGKSGSLEQLRRAGVTVVSTDLDRLRDPNPLYSSLWRLALRWWDQPGAPFGVASRRLNFKANERRLIIADDGHGQLTAVLGSANPSDVESAWSNVALRLNGGALGELVSSELAIARFSGWRGSPAFFDEPPPGCSPGRAARSRGEGVRMQLLTEGAVQEALLAQLDASRSGDSIDVAMYRIADRAVAEALLAAARRGVSVRLILDPSEGASSGGLTGIPNRVVASELVSKSGGAIRVRWYRTHGERFHSALVVVYGTRAWVLAGSATLTSRSLGDFNLVADAAVADERADAFAQQATGYFEALWSNRAGLGIEYTSDFAAFADPSQFDYWLYRLMEASGFSTF